MRNSFIAFLSNEKKKLEENEKFPLVRLGAQDCLKSIKIKDIFMNSLAKERERENKRRLEGHETIRAVLRRNVNARVMLWAPDKRLESPGCRHVADKLFGFGS